ncbi:MAG: hypothetical protein JSR82_22740 [Verrucomicrobia bacterium]|nr:hypothetical protein [Verrucomicrobiota bacterium]
MRQLPPEDQARLLPSVLSSYAEIDPPTAAAAAADLTESPSRRATFARIALTWLERDPIAARAWIERNRAAFDPADLQRLETR